MEAITNIDLIWAIIGLSSLVLAGLLYGLRQYHNTGLELKKRLEAALQNEDNYRESLHQAEKTIQQKQAELEKERELAAQKIEQFEDNRKRLTIEFENLANRILDDKARAFDKTNRISLEALLKPFREQVEGFQKRINDVHSESVKGNALLEGEIRKVLEVGLSSSGPPPAPSLPCALRSSHSGLPRHDGHLTQADHQRNRTRSPARRWRTALGQCCAGAPDR